MSKVPEPTLRERLIQSGIQELSEHGIQDFSVRRVASATGVSCAAPYKHFHDKNRFIASIIEYVTTEWESFIPEVVDVYPNDLRSQLIEISVHYVHFLVKNSHFRSIIMLKDATFDEEYANLRHKLSKTARELIDDYCAKVEMPEKMKKYKLYIVRSLIYGAALMFDNGEMEYNEENMAFLRQASSREFDLP